MSVERTTISVAPVYLKHIRQYVKAMNKKGLPSSVSGTIMEALDLALPILMARLPLKGESEDDHLLRRIKEYRILLSYIQGIYATPILKELFKLQIKAYEKGLTKTIEPLPEIREPSLKEVREMP